MLLETLQWRKSFGVNDIRIEEFPREFFECGIIQVLNDTPQGSGPKNLILVIRAEVFHRHPPVNFLFKRMIVFMANYFEQKVKGPDSKLIILSHCANIGFHSVDLELLRFCLQIKDHFPQAIECCIINNLPWFLGAMANMVLSWMPAHWSQLFKFVQTHQLPDMGLCPEQLPKFIPGGERSLTPIFPREMIASCPDLETAARMYDISQESLDFAISKITPFVNEVLGTEKEMISA